MSASLLACAKCKKLCDGETLMVGGLHYHPTCLVCTQCGIVLGGAFCQHNDTFYCVNDYKALFLPKCQACQQPLEGEIVSGEGKQYHVGCFVCSSCKKSIGPGNPYVVRGDKRVCSTCRLALCRNCDKVVNPGEQASLPDLSEITFHKTCLKCGMCSKPLDESTVKVFNKAVLCAQHFQIASQSSVDTAKVCGGCQQTIRTRAILALSKQWHEECFKCATCSESLTGAFFEFGAKPYCAKDYAVVAGQACAICTGVIAGQFLEAGGKKYHTHCITCNLCKRPLPLETQAGTMIQPGTAFRVHSKCLDEMKKEDESSKLAPGMQAEAARSPLSTAQQLGPSSSPAPSSTPASAAQAAPVTPKTELTWVATLDPESGDVYFVNMKTMDVSWERPDNFSGPLMSQDNVQLADSFPEGARYNPVTKRLDFATGPAKSEQELVEEYARAATQEAREAFRHQSTPLSPSVSSNPISPKPSEASTSTPKQVLTPTTTSPAYSINPLMSTPFGHPKSPLPVPKSMRAGTSNPSTPTVTQPALSRPESVAPPIPDVGPPVTPDQQPAKSVLSPPSQVTSAADSKAATSAPATARPSAASAQAVSLFKRALDPTSSKLTLEEILSRKAAGPLRSGLDHARLDEYLDEASFTAAFGMSREEFAALPGWKRTQKRVSLKLF
eukprot:m.85659 g.85659  ORF g.85659 m.85659 type:complete len:669 (+) comp50886_c0_seq1:53-2059(+)